MPRLPPVITATLSVRSKSGSMCPPVLVDVGSLQEPLVLGAASRQWSLPPSRGRIRIMPAGTPRRPLQRRSCGVSEKEAIDRAVSPATRESLRADLERLGLQPTMTVMVLASLSALGFVCGGAHTVVQ